MSSIIRVVLLLAVIAAAVHAAPSSEQLLKELKELRAKSKDGVLNFTDDQLRRFGTNKAKTYDLVIFLNAQQVQDNPQLNMPHLRSEFALAAKACNSDAFFVEMFFEQAPEVFQSLMAQQVRSRSFMGDLHVHAVCTECTEATLHCRGGCT